MGITRFIGQILTFMLLGMLAVVGYADIGVQKAFTKHMRQLEKQYHGRIGVSVINTSDQTKLQYNAHQRFAMCSTFKFMLVAAVLKKAMTTPGYLQQKIHYDRGDMVKGYFPLTSQNLGKGMTVSELCQAAILSDNTAANLLIHHLGGIDQINKFARSIKDKTFRLDRVEPDLNTAIPGDLRDTTTANTMSSDLQKIVLGNILNHTMRNYMIKWLQNNNTGGARIRAGVPSDWLVGDKTGTCAYGTTNDIGVIWPKGCTPIIISVFYTQGTKDAKPQDEVIKKVSSFALKILAESDRCLS